MERFIKGEVIVIPFPFSDLSGNKRRPALVLSELSGDDIILCQITSQNSSREPYSISLDENDFVNCSIMQASNIRPNRIFTASKSLIVRKLGLVSYIKI